MRTAMELMKDAQERLIEEFPYWGTLSLKLHFEEDETIRTACTNGTYLKFNSEYIFNRTEKKRMKTIAHETGHPSLLHNWRVSGMDLEVANIAADYVLDKALYEDGLADDDDFQIVDEYEGLDLEGIYSLIMKKRREQQAQEPDPEHDPDENPLEPDFPVPSEDGGDEGEDEGEGGQGGDEGDEEGEPGESGEGEDGQPGGEEGESGEGQGEGEGQPGEGEPGDAEGGNTPGGEVADGTDAKNEEYIPDLGPDKSVFVQGEPGKEGEEDPEYDWMLEAQIASMAARKAGKMSGDAERAMVASRQSPEDWKSEMSEFIVTNLPSDRSWAHPDRRYLAHDIYLPGLMRENCPGFDIFIDTSGSIDQILFNAFGTRVNTIFGELQPEYVKVGYVDTILHRMDCFEQGEEIVFNARGFGGTAFTPAFDYVREDSDTPAAILYFTDLESYDLNTIENPGIPVLWVVPPYAANTPIPFGRKIVMSLYS